MLPHASLVCQSYVFPFSSHVGRGHPHQAGGFHHRKSLIVRHALARPIAQDAIAWNLDTHSRRGYPPVLTGSSLLAWALIPNPVSLHYVTPSGLVADQLP